MEAKKQGRWGNPYFQMSASWQDLETGWLRKRYKLNKDFIFTWCLDNNKQKEFKDQLCMPKLRIWEAQLLCLYGAYQLLNVITLMSTHKKNHSAVYIKKI